MIALDVIADVIVTAAELALLSTKIVWAREIAPLRMILRIFRL